MIERSASSTSALNHTCPAKKDAHGNWTDRRLCYDARKLNDKTLADNHQLPNVDELFSKVGNSRYMTKLDLRAAFNQLRMAPECCNMLSFWWNNNLWLYNRMTYGIKNGTAAFQKVMDHELAGAKLGHCAVCFVDDSWSTATPLRTTCRT